MRVMVVWCPDWSVVAALEEAERSLRSPAAVLSRQRRRGLQRPRPRRGRTPRAAPPRRAGAVPRAAAAAGQPRPRRPGLRAGPRGRSRTCARGWPPLRPGLLAVRAPGQLVRQRDRTPPRRPAETLVEAGVWDVPGRHRRRPLHRRAGRPARPRCRRGRSSLAGGSAAFLRGLPVHVLQDDGAARSRAGRPAAAARPAHPGRPRRPAGRRGRAPARRLRRHGAAAGPGRGPDAVRGAHPAARARRGGRLRAAARLRRGDHLQRPHHRRAVRRPAGAPPARRHRGAGRGRVRRRRLLVAHLAAPAPLQRARPRRPGALAAAVAGTAVGGSLRGRKDAGVGARADRPGPVRARGRRAGGRARRGAVGRRVRRARRARRGPGAGRWSASTP